MVTTLDDVAGALGSVRQLVSADGGDVELISFDDASGTADVRLILEGAHCHVCVMPRAMLENVAVNVMRRKLPDLQKVAIDDPREHPGYVPPEL